MKARKMRERLLARQNAWDKQPQTYKNATTRPGSVKGR